MDMYPAMKRQGCVSEAWKGLQGHVYELLRNHYNVTLKLKLDTGAKVRGLNPTSMACCFVMKKHSKMS